MMTILQLHQEGLSVSAIAERTGKDRKTVRKYIRQGMVVPSYGPRLPRPCVIDAYREYVKERVIAYPELSERRLLREIRALGYLGGRTALGDLLREIRPARVSEFELRYETEPGQQAQVDFAYFEVEFDDAPGERRVVWLFAMVLGHSRYLWGRYVLHQDLSSLLRCHMAAFECFGGVPREILYDRMKTAVLGDDEQSEHVIYNAKLLALAQHYGFVPRACRAYRAKTKGKVERPYRYIRQDFFLGRRFRNLEDLNTQLAEWLATAANARIHGTTQRVVAEHFAQERPRLTALPAVAFNAVLRLERRLSHDGMVSVSSNLYSVPDGTRRRVVEVQVTPTTVHLLEEGKLIAVHPLLEGRLQRSVLPGHRHVRPNVTRQTGSGRALRLAATGHTVARRALAVYAELGRRLAEQRDIGEVTR
jgi:transposase